MLQKKIKKNQKKKLKQKENKTIKGMSREQVDSVDGDVKNRFFEGKETHPELNLLMNEIELLGIISIERQSKLY